MLLAWINLFHEYFPHRINIWFLSTAKQKREERRVEPPQKKKGRSREPQRERGNGTTQKREEGTATKKREWERGNPPQNSEREGIHHGEAGEWSHHKEGESPDPCLSVAGYMVKDTEKHPKEGKRTTTKTPKRLTLPRTSEPEHLHCACVTKGQKPKTMPQILWVKATDRVIQGGGPTPFSVQVLFKLFLRCHRRFLRFWAETSPTSGTIVN